MVRKDKTDYIGLRVTPEEKEQIKKNASLAGLSISAFLIGLAAGDKIGEQIIKSLDKDKKK